MYTPAGEKGLVREVRKRREIQDIPKQVKAACPGAIWATFGAFSVNCWLRPFGRVAARIYALAGDALVYWPKLLGPCITVENNQLHPPELRQKRKKQILQLGQK